MDAWPFADPPGLAVFTVLSVGERGAPILRVLRDADGDWQFFPDEDAVVDDAIVVGLGELVRRDPTLRALADLPLGWMARRPRVGDPWTREPIDDSNDGDA